MINQSINQSFEFEKKYDKTNSFTVATRANSVVSRNSTKQSAASFPVKSNLAHTYQKQMYNTQNP